MSIYLLLKDFDPAAIVANKEISDLQASATLDLDLLMGKEK